MVAEYSLDEVLAKEPIPHDHMQQVKVQLHSDNLLNTISMACTLFASKDFLDSFEALLVLQCLDLIIKHRALDLIQVLLDETDELAFVRPVGLIEVRICRVNHMTLI